MSPLVVLIGASAVLVNEPAVTAMSMLPASEMIVELMSALPVTTLMSIRPPVVVMVAFEVRSPEVTFTSVSPLTDWTTSSICKSPSEFRVIVPVANEVCTPVTATKQSPAPTESTVKPSTSVNRILPPLDLAAKTSTALLAVAKVMLPLEFTPRFVARISPVADSITLPASVCRRTVPPVAVNVPSIVRSPVERQSSKLPVVVAVPSIRL